MFDFGFIQDPAFALCFKKFGFHCVLPSPPCPYLSPPPPWSHYVAQTVLKLLYRPGVSVSWVLGLKMFPAFSADFLTQQWIFVSSSYLPCPTFFSCLKTFFSVLCMCVYLWESIHRCLWQPEEGIRFPWAGVRGSCGLGTELGPLQEQYGILTAEPSVRSFHSFFIVNLFHWDESLIFCFRASTHLAEQPGEREVSASYQTSVDTGWGKSCMLLLAMLQLVQYQKPPCFLFCKTVNRIVKSYKGAFYVLGLFLDHSYLL